MVEGGLAAQLSVSHWDEDASSRSAAWNPPMFSISASQSLPPLLPLASVGCGTIDSDVAPKWRGVRNPAASAAPLGSGLLASGLTL
jgi:hypothetical protein